LEPSCSIKYSFGKLDAAVFGCLSNRGWYKFSAEKKKESTLMRAS
jgi:hypothetical protein